MKNNYVNRIPRNTKLCHHVVRLPEDGQGYVQRHSFLKKLCTAGVRDGWAEFHKNVAYITWKRRMMVQMRPRVRRWFPSTMSCEPMFSRWTFCSLRNCRALSTFSRQWIRMRPFVGFGCGEEKTNKKEDISWYCCAKSSQHRTYLRNKRNSKREILVEAGGDKMTLRESRNEAHISPPDLWCRVRAILRVWVKSGTERGRLCVILTSCSPESTSRRRISMRPSRRSVYKSPMRQVTRPRWEFTHLVKVFFCTASRSSAHDKRGRSVKAAIHREHNWLYWPRSHWPHCYSRKLLVL